MCSIDFSRDQANMISFEELGILQFRFILTDGIADGSQTANKKKADYENHGRDQSLQSMDCST